ncbi:hypothetical protein B0I37DRAFT_355605 [Chaetomium sp. MPI-CAGE-AT-0009]|nr:hypothetical protein B0I37DRAFT_355605 [Chaetomium sp. MPI-CAGE-AT-0009]
MSDSKGQQTGGETVDATPGNASIPPTISTSTQNPGSPGTEAAVPQIVIQPASNQGDHEISPLPRRPTRRPPPPPVSDRNFLEVPRPSRPGSQRADPHRRSPSPTRRAFSARNLPLSLTGSADAFHVEVDPLRMHPTGVTSSSTMPVTTATGRPLGRYDGNPYTAQGREVMAKVEKMLAASKELKPETEAAPGGGSKFARLREKLRSPSFPTRLFSKSKPKEAPKPHQIRHITNLGPLPSPERLPRVPSHRLRKNERINVAMREKSHWLLGDIPRFSALLSDSAPPLQSSAEDPFSESPREEARAPTAFESRLRATKSEGALLSRAATPDPFKTERVMASNHDSLLPEPPSDSSTPLRIPAFPLPPRGVVGAQQSPTKAPRTTTTAAAAAAITTTITTTPTTTAAPTTPPAATPSSTRAFRQSRSFSHLDVAPGARPEQRRSRPCTDAGPDGNAGGHTPAAATTTTTTTIAPAPAAEAAVAVPRFALSPRLRPRPHPWAWAEEEEEEERRKAEAAAAAEMWWEDEPPTKAEAAAREWWEEEGDDDDEDDEGERERRAWERRGGMRGFGFGLGGGDAGSGAGGGAGSGWGGARWKRHPTPGPDDLAALERQLRERFPRLGAAPEESGGEAAPDAVAARWVAPPGPFSLGRGTFGGPASAGVGEEGAGAAAGAGAEEAGSDPLVRSRPASEGEDGEREEEEEGVVMSGAL